MVAGVAIATAGADTEYPIVAPASPTSTLPGAAHNSQVYRSAGSNKCSTAWAADDNEAIASRVVRRMTPTLPEATVPDGKRRITVCTKMVSASRR